MGGGILNPEWLPRREGGSRQWHGRHSSGSWTTAPQWTSRDLEGIPTWDGSAPRWRRYKKDVALWIEGINLDVSWSWAARMVRCLTGPAKTLAESIPMEELRAKPWTWVPAETPEGDVNGVTEDQEGEAEERGHGRKVMRWRGSTS